MSNNISSTSHHELTRQLIMVVLTQQLAPRTIHVENQSHLHEGHKEAIRHPKLGHFKVTIHAFICETKSTKITLSSAESYQWIKLDDFDNYAFPKANKVIIENLIHSI